MFPAMVSFWKLRRRRGQDSVSLVNVLSLSWCIDFSEIFFEKSCILQSKYHQSQYVNESKSIRQVKTVLALSMLSLSKTNRNH